MPIPHFYSSLNVAELRKVANVTERLAQANTFDPILDFKLDGAARLTRQAARTALEMRRLGAPTRQARLCGCQWPRARFASDADSCAPYCAARCEHSGE